MHPRYVVENKNVVLLSVEKEHAVFAVTNKERDIYDTRQQDPTKEKRKYFKFRNLNIPRIFQFLFMFLYLEATHLVILPIGCFHLLAEEVGDPRVPVGIFQASFESQIPKQVNV